MPKRYSLIFLVVLLCAGCATTDYSYIDNSVPIERLLATLKSDRDHGARAQAAIILGGLADLRAEDPLIFAALRDSNKKVRQNAAVGLKKLKSKKAFQLFNQAFETGDAKKNRLRSAKALSFMGDHVPLAIINLKHGKRAVRLSAVSELKEKGDKRSVDVLIETLQKRETSVAGYAAEALGRIKDQRAIEPLLKSVSQDFFHVGESAWALGEIGDSRAIDPLINILESGKAYSIKYDKSYTLLPRTRCKIAGALAKFRNQHAFDAIVEYIRECDDLADALIQMDRQDSTQTMLTVFKKVSASKRYQAAKVVNELYKKEGYGSLIQQLSKNQVDLGVMAAAHSVFIRHGAKGSEALLIEALGRYGYKDMAEAFINSENQKLRAAGYDWVAKHGYKTIRRRLPSGSATLKWGSGL